MRLSIGPTTRKFPRLFSSLSLVRPHRSRRGFLRAWPGGSYASCSRCCCRHRGRRRWSWCPRRPRPIPGRSFLCPSEFRRTHPGRRSQSNPGELAAAAADARTARCSDCGARPFPSAGRVFPCRFESTIRRGPCLSEARLRSLTPDRRRRFSAPRCRFLNPLRAPMDGRRFCPRFSCRRHDRDGDYSWCSCLSSSCRCNRLQLRCFRAGDIDHHGPVRRYPFHGLWLWRCRASDIDHGGSVHKHPLHGLQLWEKPGSCSRLHPRCRCRCRPRAEHWLRRVWFRRRRRGSGSCRVCKGGDVCVWRGVRGGRDSC